MPDYVLAYLQEKHLHLKGYYSCTEKQGDTEILYFSIKFTRLFWAFNMY